MPVLPLVASTTVWPGFSAPDFSPASITARARRSFTDPRGLKASIFANRFTPGGASRLILTTGVLPIVSRIFEYPGNDRQHAGRENQPARAARGEPVREDRGLQSPRVGEGPPGPRSDRSWREIRGAEAGPDGGRGNERQHRHRPCDGVCREGLSA